MNSTLGRRRPLLRGVGLFVYCIAVSDALGRLVQEDVAITIAAVAIYWGLAWWRRFDARALVGAMVGVAGSAVINGVVYGRADELGVALFLFAALFAFTYGRWFLRPDPSMVGPEGSRNGAVPPPQPVVDDGSQAM